MNQKNKFMILCVLSSVFSFLAFSGCTQSEKMYRESRMLMDTICTITVVSTSERQAKDALEAGFKEIEKLEKLLDYYSPLSEITVINKASGIHPVKVSEETLEVIKEAVKIAAVTKGAFDPTIGPVMKLWGFNLKISEYAVPSEGDVRDILRLVDYRDIKINETESEIFLAKEGMELDLGGIAKGYATDGALDILKGKGMQAALVAIAGDIKGFGLKPDQKPWKVGIQNPRSPGDASEGGEEIFATLYLENSAISTSGDYQRFFIEQGQRYHHIIDPRTGYPSSDVISVSVIAPEGLLSDGLSTGIFILGREKGMELLESLGYSGVLIDRKKKIYITEDLKGRIESEEGI
ncbi:FAD:protein FMN transferase [bacterium]|nr:MAG: FAD:protein FMN transferase [bacterium]